MHQNSLQFHFFFLSLPKIKNLTKTMTNKRTLKKAISLICEELITECIAASLYGAQNQKENAEALLSSIIRMESDFICRISHPEPGMSPRVYFNDLREKFLAQASEMIDQINTL